MTEKPTYLTPEGLEKLKAELEYLRTVRRPAIAAQIHQAKEGGDIMENSGYDEAKNIQAFIEGRIMTLEAMLRDVVVIDSSQEYDRICLGSRVKVQEEDGQPEEFLIVGAAEADPTIGRISDESPLGKALLGSRVGDRVTVQTPGGTLSFCILSIR